MDVAEAAKFRWMVDVNAAAQMMGPRVRHVDAPSWLGPATAGPVYGGPSYGGPSYGGPSYGGPSYTWSDNMCRAHTWALSIVLLVVTSACVCWATHSCIR